MARSPEFNAVRRWNEAEDDVIRNAVTQFEKKDQDVNWHAIAARLPGRNNKDCRKRWVYNLAPSINKGAWTEDEDRLLLQGIQQNGFRWPLVAQAVESRQPDQCARRWRESLNPGISHDRWSLHEDETLKEAVQVYGRKWTEIVDRFLPNRTPIAAKKRYAKRFQRKQHARRVDSESSRASDPILKLEETSLKIEPAAADIDLTSDANTPDLLLHAIDYSQMPPKVPVKVDGDATGPSLSSTALDLSSPSYDVDITDFQYNESSDLNSSVTDPVPFQPNINWSPDDSFFQRDGNASWGWDQRGSFSECASDPDWAWIQNAQVPDTPVSLTFDDHVYYSDPGFIETETLNHLVPRHNVHENERNMKARPRCL